LRARGLASYAAKEMVDVFLTAEWRNLLMVNYEIDPAILAPHVPVGTQLDSFNGRTFVSVVGFHFLRTRVLGVPVPGYRKFDEVNLRFYVSRQTAGECLRGVVFVKEIVPKRAIAWLARRLYNERYVAMPMRSTVKVPGRAEYAWRHGGSWDGLSAYVTGAPYQPAPDSEEAFITEHYWGYSKQRDGGTVEYRVTHPAWRVYRCASPVLDCRVAALYGDAFVSALAGPPSSALLAEGSAVSVHRGRRI
jgi:uncharacterized protein YqjF (DUF2071 family)